MSGGEATPFVLVHGFADSAATWQQLVPHLGDDAPTYCWDLPGHGARSGAGESPKTRDEAVQELAERIAGLGGPVTLVGHSLGGYLTLMLAIDRPQLIDSVALISSGPGFRNHEARASWNSYMDAIGTKTGVAAGTTAMAHQPDSYVIDNLSSIGCPLVHVIGANDTRYRAGAQYVRKVLPQSRLVEVAGAGHHPQRSHPAEVASAIRECRSSLVETMSDPRR